MGWDCVHLVRRPQIGLLYQLRLIDDESEQSAEWELVGETEVLGEDHITWHELEPGPPRWEAGD
jgi:hypothetical protein